MISKNIFFTWFIFLYESKKQGDEPGILEQIKTQVCDNISLYAQNYSEDFGDYLPRFVTAVWNLLTTTGLQIKYDLVSYC